MKTLLTAALSAGFLFLAPVSAQVFGSVNRGAPRCSSSIEFADGGMVKLSYTSVTYAQGKFEKNLDRMRDFVNRSADQQPIGQLEVKGTGVMFGGKAVPAGQYDFKFNLTEKNEWKLIVASKNGKVSHDWVLPLKDGGKKQERLRLALQAGDSNTGLECMIAFGTKGCVVDGQKHEMKDAPSTGNRSRPTSRRR